MFILMQEGKVYKFYVDLRELHGNGFQFATTHKKIQSAMLFLVLSHVPDLCKVEQGFLLEDLTILMLILYQINQLMLLNI